MGMTLSLYSIEARHVDVLLANPALAWKVIAYDDPEWASETIENAGVSADEAEKLQLDEEGVAEADLDKAWHGIHYLLTGSAWEGEAPLNFLLHGGTPLGAEDEDEESEPVPRLFRPDEVQEIDRALDDIDVDLLRERYDPARMQELDIYPNIWDQGEETIDYCLQYFGELQDFVADTTRQQRAMLIFVG